MTTTSGAHRDDLNCEKTGLLSVGTAGGRAHFAAIGVF